MAGDALDDVSLSPRMIPEEFLSSISDTFDVPPLVMSNVTGPDATLIWLGVQPPSTSVTATFLASLAPLPLEPQPATPAVVTIAQQIAARSWG